MTAKELLDYAARLFAEQGGDAEVCVPIIITSKDVLNRAGIDPNATMDRRYANAYVEAFFRCLADDTPDRVQGVEEWLLSKAVNEIPPYYTTRC